MLNPQLKEAYEREARNGFEVSQTLGSEGFSVLNVAMNNRLIDLDVIMKATNDPNEAFACIKEKIGILFFLDTARELVERGKSAAQQLVVS